MNDEFFDESLLSEENSDNNDATEFYAPVIEESPEYKYDLIIESIGKTFEINGLDMNGSNYVSENEIDTSKWPEIFKLTVKRNNEVFETYEHAKLIQQIQYSWDNNRFYLAFCPISTDQVEKLKMKSDLEYLAMMTDVDIE